MWKQATTPRSSPKARNQGTTITTIIITIITITMHELNYINFLYITLIAAKRGGGSFIREPQVQHLARVHASVLKKHLQHVTAVCASII